MDYNNFHFSGLLNKPIKRVINAFIESVQLLSPIKNDHYKRNVKYTLNDYIIGIIDVTKNFHSWNSYNGFMKGDTLRKKHIEWCKLGVYEKVYEILLSKKLKESKITEELKYRSIDSTFIQDINGSDFSSYNGIYKHRKGESAKGIKITSIVTTTGIPISVQINTGKNYDSPLLSSTVDQIRIDCNTKKYQNHNRFKQYLLADSGYDSKENLKLLHKKGYTPIIKQNKRNIRKKELVQQLNNKQKKIYKKRNIIENYHSWLKKFQKVKSLYERNINSYKGLLLIAVSVIISRRIHK